MMNSTTKNSTTKSFDIASATPQSLTEMYDYAEFEKADTGSVSPSTVDHCISELGMTREELTRKFGGSLFAALDFYQQTVCDEKEEAVKENVEWLVQNRRSRLYGMKNKYGVGVREQDPATRYDYVALRDLFNDVDPLTPVAGTVFETLMMLLQEFQRSDDMTAVEALDAAIANNGHVFTPVKMLWDMVGVSRVRQGRALSVIRTVVSHFSFDVNELMAKKGAGEWARWCEEFGRIHEGPDSVWDVNDEFYDTCAFFGDDDVDPFRAFDGWRSALLGMGRSVEDEMLRRHVWGRIWCDMESVMDGYGSDTVRWVLKSAADEYDVEWDEFDEDHPRFNELQEAAYAEVMSEEFYQRRFRECKAEMRRSYRSDTAAVADAWWATFRALEAADDAAVSADAVRRGSVGGVARERQLRAMIQG